jgi:hypothetical protein
MVLFVAGVGYPTDLFVKGVWDDAFHLCDTILNRPASRERFLLNASEDFVAAAYDIGIQQTYTVELSMNVEDFNSYAHIFPTAAFTVNFNPVLVLNIYKEFAPRPAPPTAPSSTTKVGGVPLQDVSVDLQPTESSGKWHMSAFSVAPGRIPTL